ncbi:MAG TPA: 1,4-dihydroxy-2-naphthoate polyprenyltransferase [Bacteroidetes bacterium]|nr:1,4-dihydroxy-2-naphthoate polyprenyltransferase [Bacteroidota bacterium]
MSKINSWITAFRLRTLPLSLSCISMGAFLAYFRGHFDFLIFVFSFLTTISLQILSNLANDYGDTVFGADNNSRKGPDRMVQLGLITISQMKRMIIVFIILSLIFGILLLYFSHLNFSGFLIFLTLGILAIIAAVNYTIGMKKPYGYKGFGDISVFVFFGLVAVLGVYFLYAKSFDWQLLLPASTCGFFATAVLNINNMRDIDSDKLAGKKSIPVRIGIKRALTYHFLLLFGGILLSLVFVLLNYKSPFQLIFLLSLPLFIKNYLSVKNSKTPEMMDPFLKQMAISTLIFVLLFGAGTIF